MAELPDNVKTVNRYAIRLAGRRAFPLWAVLRHRGRRSGKPYKVPVAVLTTEATFVIALPYGRGTDWVRNIRAAGACTIRWRGRDWDCREPTFVGPDVALHAAGPLLGRILQRHVPSGGYLQVSRSPS